VNRRAIVAAAVVFAVGVSLRLDALTASLWLDEFGTFWVVEGDFHTMLGRAWAFQGQSPLYYTLAWGSIQVFGESELALRIPSLLLGSLSLIAVYLCARAIEGPKAGLYAAGLFWLSVPSVQSAVNARPYALVFFSVAVALAGFVCAVRSGSRRGRLVWIVGGAAVAWAHYTHYPIVIGLYIAYAALPALRARYSIRRFATDGVLQLALVSLCSPQIVALIARRGTLSWIADFKYAVLLQPIWPLLIGVVICVAQLARDDASVARALRTALLICLAFQMAAIAGASVIGINLLSGRYLLSILIPTVVLVGATLARVTVAEAIAILVVFAVTTGAVFGRMKAGVGSFSGIGSQDWRSAVDDLRAGIGQEGNALVLFRSGFVEEDVVPLGSPPPAVFAPLRSPGRPVFPTGVVPLNFRWAHPQRDEYFAEAIAPKVDGTSAFFVIGAQSDATVGNYMNKVVEWVESRWPARYRVRRTDYGGVELIEFQPLLITQATSADKAR
jgi:hypothetical protein